MRTIEHAGKIYLTPEDDRSQYVKVKHEVACGHACNNMSCPCASDSCHRVLKDSPDVYCLLWNPKDSNAEHAYHLWTLGRLEETER